MLPPFIIEQIRQREEQERRKHERQQPRLELPLDIHHPASRPPSEDEEDADRGVTILDFG
jgi:hypothetical protein